MTGGALLSADHIESRLSLCWRMNASCSLVSCTYAKGGRGGTGGRGGGASSFCFPLLTEGSRLTPSEEVILEAVAGRPDVPDADDCALSSAAY